MMASTSFGTRAGLRSSFAAVALLLAWVALSTASCSDDGGSSLEDTCEGASCAADTRQDTTFVPDTYQDTHQQDVLTGQCSPGQKICADATTLRFCNAASEWEDIICIDALCNPAAPACLAPACSVPGQPFACESETQERVCSNDQFSYDVLDCTGEEKCLSTGCTILACTPGARRCKAGVNASEECAADGSMWVESMVCAENEVCGSSGVCQSLCELETKTSSFLGCEYYVVDLDNASGTTDDSPFGITVSNPHPALTARVTVNGAGVSVVRDVPPNDLLLIDLNPNTDVSTSGLHAQASFHVISSIPVTVHQFNPINGQNVYSNDASLLLPVNALGTEYLALNYPSTSLLPPSDNIYDMSCSGAFDCIFVLGSCGAGGYCVSPCTSSATCQALDPSLVCGSAGTCEFGGSTAYVDVVGTVDGTQVTITSPVEISSSATFPGIPAGGTYTATLNAGDLLHLLSPGRVGIDVSGLEVSAETDKPVAVFSGNVCTFIPDKTAWCDHIEQQLFPTSTWGRRYVAAKSFPRGTEEDYWRIIASEDGTTVNLAPAQNGISTRTLNRGETLDVVTAEHFEASADKPILVGQFLAGSNHPGIPFTCGRYDEGKACTVRNDCLSLCAGDQGCEVSMACEAGACVSGSGLGDPAYSLAVPTAQFRIEYIVLTPTGYAENYLTVISPRGIVPFMDGASITDAPLSAVAQPLNTNWDIYRFPVVEGVHGLQASQNFGVIAYGYNCDVSYAYPGGLNLEIIN